MVEPEVETGGGEVGELRGLRSPRQTFGQGSHESGRSPLGGEEGAQEAGGGPCPEPGRQVRDQERLGLTQPPGFHGQARFYEPARPQLLTLGRRRRGWQEVRGIFERNRASAQVQDPRARQRGPVQEEGLQAHALAVCNATLSPSAPALIPLLTCDQRQVRLSAHGAGTGAQPASGAWTHEQSRDARLHEVTAQFPSHFPGILKKDGKLVLQGIIVELSQKLFEIYG